MTPSVESSLDSDAIGSPVVVDVISATIGIIVYSGNDIYWHLESQSQTISRTGMKKLKSMEIIFNVIQNIN